jgi:hypothetical protein
VILWTTLQACLPAYAEENWANCQMFYEHRVICARIFWIMFKWSFFTSTTLPQWPKLMVVYFYILKQLALYFRAPMSTNVLL